jgi:hypothetical protein
MWRKEHLFNFSVLLTAHITSIDDVERDVGRFIKSKERIAKFAISLNTLFQFSPETTEINHRNFQYSVLSAPPEILRWCLPNINSCLNVEAVEQPSIIFSLPTVHSPSPHNTEIWSSFIEGAQKSGRRVVHNWDISAELRRRVQNRKWKRQNWDVECRIGHDDRLISTNSGCGFEPSLMLRITEGFGGPCSCNR